MSKFSFLMRTTPNIQELLRPLQRIINDQLITSLFGSTITEELRSVLTLPCREGGMGIPALNDSESQYNASKAIFAPLIGMVTGRVETPLETIEDRQKQAKNRCITEKRQRQKLEKESILAGTSPELRHAVQLAKEKGASAWLNLLPIKSEGFALTKSHFRDCLYLRYGKTPLNLPTKCACAADYTVEHALSCAKGGFPIVRHNEIRDLFASVMTEVCHGVSIEPHLQSVDRPLPSGTNIQDGARLDIEANGVWGGRFEKTMFDVRVFNPPMSIERGTHRIHLQEA